MKKIIASYIKLVSSLQKYSLPLFVLGGVSLLWHNWRAWQRDMQQISTLPRRKPPELHQWSSYPFVSVLVAAWNEAALLKAHLESFAQLRYPHKELILCVGGEDGSYELAQEFLGEQVTILRQMPGEGKYRALRRSLVHAHGEIIFLTDADSILNSASFEALLYPIASGEETITTGMFKPLAQQQNSYFIRTQWAALLYPELMRPSDYTNQLTGANAMLKRDIVEAGWAIERIPIGEDAYLALKAIEAGHHIRLVRESVIETEFPASVAAYTRQKSRWLLTLWRFGQEFDEPSHLRHLLQTALIGYIFLAMPLLSLLLGWLGAACWLLAWLAVILARLRYISVLKAVEKVSGHIFSWQLLRLILLDFTIWARIPSRIWREEEQSKW